MSTEFNRNALVIYLRDVVSLEFIRYRLCRTRKSYTYRLNAYEGNYYCERFELRYRYVHLKYQGGRILVARKKVYEYGQYYDDGVYNEMSLNDSNRYYWMDINAHMDRFGTPIAWKPFTPGNGRRGWKQVRSEFFNIYYDFRNHAEQKLQNKITNYNWYQNSIASLNKKIAETEGMLLKLYSVNIIPRQYRCNLYCAWYLYDFISSSQESFSSALMHFDLNEIKKRLNQIIENQEEIIINQAILASQNKAIIDNENQHLKKLASIETNTEYAAQYAQIASDNAEACAWISMANFLK